MKKNNKLYKLIREAVEEEMHTINKDMNAFSTMILQNLIDGTSFGTNSSYEVFVDAQDINNKYADLLIPDGQTLMFTSEETEPNNMAGFGMIPDYIKEIEEDYKNVAGFVFVNLIHIRKLCELKKQRKKEQYKILFNELIGCINHELTHAINRINSNSRAKGQQSVNINSENGTGFISWVLYNLEPSEINAHMTNVYQTTKLIFGDKTIVEIIKEENKHCGGNIQKLKHYVINLYIKHILQCVYNNFFETIKQLQNSSNDPDRLQKTYQTYLTALDYIKKGDTQSATDMFGGYDLMATLAIWKALGTDITRRFSFRIPNNIDNLYDYNKFLQVRQYIVDNIKDVATNDIYKKSVNIIYSLFNTIDYEQTLKQNKLIFIDNNR